MSETRWTPGPWEVVEIPEPNMISEWEIQMAGYGLPFFPYVHIGGYVKDPVMIANAHLIAAAPDMAEALDRIIKERRMGLTTPEAWDQARAALAKARGERDE
jgi:hypothetical protein